MSNTHRDGALETAMYRCIETSRLHPFVNLHTGRMCCLNLGIGEPTGIDC